MGATPEGLIQRLEEETRVNAYIATEKLPKELEAQQAAVKSLQKVISQPALGQDDIRALKEKIRLVQDEVRRILVNLPRITWNFCLKRLSNCSSL